MSEISGRQRRVCVAVLRSLPSNAELDARRDEMSEEMKMMLTPVFAAMTEITQCLFLTGVGGLTSDNLDNNGITCVINATYEAPSIDIPGIEFIRIAVDDSADEDIYPFLEIAANKVDEVRANLGKTVIHCVAGVSRSGTLAIAYLIKYKRKTLRNAFNWINDKRKVVRPNNAFFVQLIRFEEEQLGRISVRMATVERDGVIITVPDFFLDEHPTLVRLEVVKAKKHLYLTRD